MDKIEAMEEHYDTNVRPCTMADTSTNEGDAESATTTDCISRQKAIEALTGWQTEPLDEDIVRTLNNLPPVTPTKRTTETMIVDGEEIEIDPVSYEIGYTHGQTAPTVSEDCISRAEALDEFKKDYDDVFDLMTSIEELPSVTPTEPKPVMTEEVREALMRLTMCAREECTICKYENDCGFDEQVEMATENMHTILNAFDTTDMAIEALKAEPIRCGECENYIDRRCIEANHHVAAHENCMEVFGAKRREL